jgi:hypothetical protein
MITIASPAFSGSTRGDDKICDPQIIAQTKQGKSSKEEVKQLIGEPDKVESALNQGELWQYSHEATMPSGRAGGSAFKSFGSDNIGSGRVSMEKKSVTYMFILKKTVS